MAGVAVRFVTRSGEDSPLEWVISHNAMRRHVTSNQWAVIAHDILPRLEKEAKQRQYKRSRKGRELFLTLREMGRLPR
jgi:hypothetical protein